MLHIKIPPSELYDEENSKFIKIKGADFQIEHSLVSISKWESKWKKPFLGTDKKSKEQIIDYIRCMTITQNVNQEVYNNIPPKVFDEISKYIDDPMTAAWFSEDKDSKKNNEVITSEIIYHWMIAQQIPIECQKWHLNKLLTQIRVCSLKNAPPKKMSKKDALEQQRILNAQRRAKYGTKG